MKVVDRTKIYPYTDRRRGNTDRILRVDGKTGGLTGTRNTVYLNGNDFFTSVLIAFLENVIRYLVSNTKRLEGLTMRKGLCLVLKVKPFKIFTTIHDS